MYKSRARTLMTVHGISNLILVKVSNGKTSSQKNTCKKTEEFICVTCKVAFLELNCKNELLNGWESLLSPLPHTAGNPDDFH